MHELEKQLRRKDKGLAEAAALLVLQKKGERFAGPLRGALARWRAEGETGDRRREPWASPAHKLTSQERERVLAAANRLEYRNLSPRQIVPLLADRGEYIGSDSTTIFSAPHVDDQVEKETRLELARASR